MNFAEHFQEGDLVYANTDLLSDGQVPGTQEGQLLARRGTRGMVVKVGYIEASPEVDVYLVRFEDEEAQLGPVLGCLGTELTQREIADNQMSAL